MSRNDEYFKRYCEVVYALIKRDDRDNPAIKSIIRYVVREASNHCSDLPGYDNKLGAEIVSTSAYKQISDGAQSGFVGEHIVPVSVINKALLELSELNVEKISKTIRNLSKRAVITTTEDKLLKEKGLSKKMPDGWKWDGKNIMARYEAVGIKTKEINYKECKKKYRKRL